jgi:predicted RNase H-like HicB family nuclease
MSLSITCISRVFTADLSHPGLARTNSSDITLAMKKLTIIIEKTKDMYTAYAENMKGIYGGGNTIEEAKESINTSLQLYNKYNNLIKQEYEITYKIL